MCVRARKVFLMRKSGTRNYTYPDLRNIIRIFVAVVFFSATVWTIVQEI